MAKRKAIGKLFLKPVGASERRWNNNHHGTTVGITCEPCGTNHPELNPNDDSRTVDTFLGLQMVEECCGRAFDVLYGEIGEEFTLAFLEDFTENPGDPRFSSLLFHLPELLARAAKKATENATALQSAVAAVLAIGASAAPRQ